MALRNPARDFIQRFRGLNNFEDAENLTYDWWTDALNVWVNPHGSAEVLRSPRGVNVALTTGNPILSMADYLSSVTHKLLFDIEIQQSENPRLVAKSTSNVKLKSTSTLVLMSSAPKLTAKSTSTIVLKSTSTLYLNTNSAAGAMTTYTISDDLTNLAVRSDQAVYPFISLISNGKLFRVNQAEMIQYMTDAVTHYPVGITGPAAAPTIAYTTGGSGSIASGIQFSYAYYNSTTQHCSIPSDVSNRLTAGTTSVLVPVVASTETGVDKLVFFATLDGGDVPYLLVDSNGDLVTQLNSTGSYSFSIADLHYDTLTPEPLYNEPPPLGAQFMFAWKDRIFLMDFVSGSTVDKSQAAYSGNESVYIGQNGESYPLLNIVQCTNRGETLKGGVGTQVGALFLSDFDAYLLSGYPPDKTQGPEATTAVTEHLEPLHWAIGTRSAQTIRSTPFGQVWLDQTACLRKWNGEGIPVDAAVPLRAELAKIDRSNFANCEAAWYQMGRNGGCYILTAPLTTGEQQMFFVTLYQDPQTNEVRVGYAISDIQAYTLQPIRVFNDVRMLYGGVDRVFSILDSEKAGDGWSEGTEIFFEQIFGSEDNFRNFHSIRFDGDNSAAVGLTITVRDFGEAVSTARTLTLEQDDDTGTTWAGLIDEYGHRKIIRFSYDLADMDAEPASDESSDGSEEVSSPISAKNLQVIYGKKKRII